MPPAFASAIPSSWRRGASKFRTLRTRRACRGSKASRSAGQRSVAWSGLRLGCRAPRLVKFSKRRERDRQLRRPYFKRSNSTFARSNTRTNGSPPSSRTSMVRLIWFFALKPCRFDREFPRFRFGLLLTAVYLALLIMQAGVAFYNVETITWHRKHHCSRDRIISVVSTGRPKPLVHGIAVSC